ncbi:hypothetical protein Pcinc_041217 [Petrolisthes cinctipes]|uniref:Uncharacterized protein n=1 Tax=Petrolisthes cinctipes TaxID=88211 RepID=A0AAE1BLH2_PETCI|nr:hypothetical protein Pcinc_041998 [Petrolisthes cinctipes]KAK3852186.1 hypothetical protein Pcinc_041217 [Petrolisthes cinctipes]
MNIYFKLLVLLIVVLGVTCDAKKGKHRIPRQFFQQQTTYRNRESRRYQMCRVDDTVAACLTNQQCDRQRGAFLGYCGATDDYCCLVDKTCGDKIMSHQAYFRNPDYPNKNNESRICNLELEIQRKVCAVRLNFDTFELAGFEDGVCIRDTLTILGSDNPMPVTPVCGNLTKWATTFEVKERTLVTLAMVLQGKPAHRFSISITQLACDHIVPFKSPTFSGVKNVNASKYDPPTTTTTEATTDTTTITEETTTDIPTTEVPTTVIPNVRVGGVGTTEATEEPKPTTLTPGKLPTPSSDQVLIRALPESEDDVEVEEGVDPVPVISAFRQAFELKVNDKCWQYDKEQDTGFRVIGGGYTNVNEYPWQMGLVYKHKFFCGGSLISDRHVLTAAHCVFGSFSKGLGSLRVTLGDHDLSTKDDTENVAAKVKSIFWHLHYNPHATHNDIAILELENPVNYSYGISAVRIPSDLDEQYDLTNATVTGWGRFRVTAKKTSTILKEFTSPIMNTTKCVAAWNKFPGINANLHRHVCMDVTLGTPCHGDSGGPLVVCTGAHCTQVGLVSFGFPMCTNVGLPAVFTRITYYKKWMDINLHQTNFIEVV